MPVPMQAEGEARSFVCHFLIFHSFTGARLSMKEDERAKRKCAYDMRLKEETVLPKRCVNDGIQ